MAGAIIYTYQSVNCMRVEHRKFLRQTLEHMQLGNTLTLPDSETDLDWTHENDDYYLKWDSDSPDVDRVMMVVEWGSADDPYNDISLVPPVALPLQDARPKARRRHVSENGSGQSLPTPLSAASGEDVPELVVDDKTFQGNHGNRIVCHAGVGLVGGMSGRACFDDVTDSKTH